MIPPLYDIRIIWNKFTLFTFEQVAQVVQLNQLGENIHMHIVGSLGPDMNALLSLENKVQLEIKGLKYCSELP